VLVVRYGEEVGRSEVGGRSGFSWWREVVMGETGIGGGFFEKNIVRRVGNGRDTFFRMDSWLGGSPLYVCAV